MMNMHLPPKTLILSALLILVQGCAQEYYHGTRNPFESVVGPHDSKAPIKVGVSSKGDVVNLLGKPLLQDEKGGVFGYNEYVDAGVGVIWPILIPVHGGSIQGLYDEYAVFMRFGPDSILTEYEFILPDEENHKLYLEKPFEAFRARAGPVTRAIGVR